VFQVLVAGQELQAQRVHVEIPALLELPAPLDRPAFKDHPEESALLERPERREIRVLLDRQAAVGLSGCQVQVEQLDSQVSLELLESLEL